MSDTVQVVIKDAIAQIVFNRPQAMNTLNEQMAKDLQQALGSVRQNDSIRAVLLKGAGANFMAGGDIRFFAEHLEHMSDHIYGMLTHVHAAITTIYDMPKPVVAMVHGSVAGAGMSLMLATDLVIAASDTIFTMAYSKLGVSPDGGSTYALPKLVGNKKAMELILLSDRFNAQQALEYGLINWHYPLENCEQHCEELLQRLAEGPTFAHGRAKRLVNKSWDHSLATQLVAEAEAFANCCESKDFKSAVQGFIAKKAVKYEGC